MTIRRITALAATFASGPLAAQALPGLDNFSIERTAPVVTPVPTPTPTPSATPTPNARPTPSPSPTPLRNRPTAAATPTPGATATPTPAASTTRPPATAAPSLAIPSSVPAPTPLASPRDPGVAISVGPPDAPARWPLWAALAALLVAIGAALGAAVALAWRRRTDARGEPSDELMLDAAVAAPEPVATPSAVAAAAPIAPEPLPAPEPKPRLPGGLITSSLKPALGFDLQPRQGVVDTERATLDYNLVIRNTGRAAALDVMVEVWLLSGSAQQDDDLAYVLGLDPGDPALPPFRLLADAAVDLSGQVVAGRDTLAVITAGGRTMFVPLIAVRARFRDQRGTVQSASAAFMVGIDRSGSDRLAPLPLDRGAQVNDRLAVRRYDLG